MQLFEKIWSGKTSREREGAYRGLGLTQCPHADSPTDVRSPRQCGPRQTQANSNLVIVPPESDSQVTQVAIWGGVGKWPSGPHRPEPQRDNSFFADFGLSNCMAARLCIVQFV